MWPNQVTLDFNPYGIILSTDRPRAPASGFIGSFIIGEVRVWQDGDTDEPTGAVLPGVEIQVTTDLGGFLVGDLEYFPEITKTTNEWGMFGVYLTSSDRGTATVTASAGGSEFDADLSVEFERVVALVVDNSPTPVDSLTTGEDARSIKQYCTVFEKFTDGERDYESIRSGRGPASYHYSGHHVVGEEVKFAWSPGTNCEADDLYTGPYFSGAYLHYYYDRDYNHQITQFMIGQQNPLTQKVEFTTILLKQNRSHPSPFDLSAPERYVLGGFQELRE